MISSLTITFVVLFFFFNDTATTEIYTLSLHDALPICTPAGWLLSACTRIGRSASRMFFRRDRKSTRLNSSHQIISYAVFCLKKKNIHGRFGVSRIASDKYITYSLFTSSFVSDPLHSHT